MEQEKDSSVRLVTAQLLVDLVVTCSSSKCADILAVVKKVTKLNQELVFLLQFHVHSI